jgi:MFS family permease
LFRQAAASAVRRGLFAEPDFRRLWFVGFAVFLVRWLETLVTGLFTWNATGSAFLVAMMTMLRLLPMGLFGAFLGAWAERVEGRTALLLTVLGCLFASLAAALLANAGALAVWHLGALSFVNGLGWAADNPVRRLMIGQAVGADRMGAAMSWDVGASNASRLLGPTLGGAVLAGVGIAGAFWVSVALYGAALAAALALRARVPPRAPSGAGVLARIGEGLAAARRDSRLTGTLIVTVVFNLFGWPFNSLVPVVGQEHLRLGPEAVGLLAGMDGIGAFAGALLIAWFVPPAAYGRCYLGGITLYLASVALFALAPHPLPAGAALALNGFGGSGFSVMQATLVYIASPPELRSRVLGILSVCIGLGPVGFVHIGLLAEAIGPRGACVVSAAEGLLALLLTRRWWRDLLAHDGRRPA